MASHCATLNPPRGHPKPSSSMVRSGPSEALGGGDGEQGVGLSPTHREDVGIIIAHLQEPLRTGG